MRLYWRRSCRLQTRREFSPACRSVAAQAAHHALSSRLVQSIDSAQAAQRLRTRSTHRNSRVFRGNQRKNEPRTFESDLDCCGGGSAPAYMHSCSHSENQSELTYRLERNNLPCLRPEHSKRIRLTHLSRVRVRRPASLQRNFASATSACVC
jgi:hypothetical protein